MQRKKPTNPRLKLCKPNDDITTGPITPENLKFLLEKGIKKVIRTQEGLVQIIFRQARVARMFCGLCCFIDTIEESGKISRGKAIFGLRDFLVPDYCEGGRIILRFDPDLRVSALWVFLPTFFKDVSEGKVKKKYRVICYKLLIPD